MLLEQLLPPSDSTHKVEVDVSCIGQGLHFIETFHQALSQESLFHVIRLGAYHVPVNRNRKQYLLIVRLKATNMLMSMTVVNGDGLAAHSEAVDRMCKILPRCFARQRLHARLYHLLGCFAFATPAHRQADRQAGKGEFPPEITF